MGSFVLLITRALPDGLNTQILGNSLFENSINIVPSLGMADSAWYLTAALDLRDFKIETQNSWIFNLWPPGMIIYYYFLDAVTFGSGVIFLHLVILSFLWSLNYTLFSNYLIDHKANLSFIAFTFLWIFSPLVNYWKSEVGFFTADVLALNISTLLLIKVFISRPINSMNKRKFFIFSLTIVVLLSFLSHLRIIWMVTILIMITLGWIFVLIDLVLNKSKNRYIVDPVSTHLSFKSYGLIFLVFIFSLLPWTLLAEKHVRPGTYSWIKGGDYSYAQRWMPSQYLSDNGATFLIEGGANWACIINNEMCSQIFVSESNSANPYSGQNLSYIEFRDLAFSQIKQKPIDFFKFKYRITVDAWLTNPGDKVGGNRVIFGMITLAGLAVALIITILRRPKNLLLILVAFLTHLVYLGSIVINHFETRYLLPLHAFSIIVFFFVWTNTILDNTNSPSRAKF
jgi:hypothetical protein